MNNLNELTTNSWSGTLTVAGTATEQGATYSGAIGVTSVTVRGTGLSSGVANLYFDGTWARTNATPASGANSYTATAQDTYGRVDTGTISCLLSNTSFLYDLNGNLLSDGTRSFSYDDENELTSVRVTNAWRSDFVYDGMMRRRIRREYTWSGSTWLQTNEVHYVYDGLLVIQERDANNLPSVTYTRGNDLSGSLQDAGGIGGLLARSDNHPMAIGDPNAHAFYEADGNGNITAMVNSLGAIVARYLYDPFGNILSMSGPLADANLYRFSSKESHVNSGLVYYGQRFYEARTQRWLNRDPLSDPGGLVVQLRDQVPFESWAQGVRLVAGDPMGSRFENLQGFGLNNPLTYFDAYGESCAAAVGKALMYGAETTAGATLGDAALFGLTLGVPVVAGVNYIEHYAPPGSIAPPVGLSIQNAPPEFKLDSRVQGGHGLGQLQGLEDAIKDAVKTRPKIKGPDADPDWEDAKSRPKQQKIRSKGKSESSAKSKGYDDDEEECE